MQKRKLEKRDEKRTIEKMTKEKKKIKKKFCMVTVKYCHIYVHVNNDQDDGDQTYILVYVCAAHEYTRNLPVWQTE